MVCKDKSEMGVSAHPEVVGDVVRLVQGLLVV